MTEWNTSPNTKGKEVVMRYNSKAIVKDLIHLRDAIGISLREASKDIGISPSTLSRIENGKTPDIITYALICKWLNSDLKKYLQ